MCSFNLVLTWSYENAYKKTRRQKPIKQKQNTQKSIYGSNHPPASASCILRLQWKGKKIGKRTCIFNSFFFPEWKQDLELWKTGGFKLPFWNIPNTSIHSCGYPAILHMPFHVQTNSWDGSEVSLDKKTDIQKPQSSSWRMTWSSCWSGFPKPHSGTL